MKFKGTWFLALLAVALGLYVYLIEIKKAAKDEEKKNAEEKILDFDSSKVKSLNFKNSKGEFTVEKDGTDWKLVKPLTDKADQSVINNILTALGSEKFDEAIDAQTDADLKNFGLDNPVESLTITNQDGTIKKLSIGQDAAIPGKVYLQRGDEKKALYANSGIKIQLDKTIKDLRDKDVFRKNKDDITRFELKVNSKDAHGQVALSKKDGKWFLDSKGEEADGEVTETFLKTLTSLNATDFPSENASDKAEKKKYDLSAPEIEVTLYGKDNVILDHMMIGSKNDKNNVFVTVEGVPTIYQLFASSTESLLKKPEDFRNKKLPLEFKKEDVADINIKTSASEAHLVKKASSWELFLPDEAKVVSQIQVTNFLDRLSDLKVADYVDKEKPVGLNPPLGHIVLKNSKDEVIFDFSWGDRAKVQRNDYAKSSKYKGLFTVDGSAIAGIPIQTLVERKSTPVPTAAPSSAVASGTPSPQSTPTK